MKTENYISVICDFSDIDNIDYHIVVNDDSDNSILVNKQGCYLDCFVTQYTNLDDYLNTVKVFGKIQAWFKSQSIGYADPYYGMVTFLNEFKVRGYKFVYRFCNTKVDSTNLESQEWYAMANDSLAVIEEILKLKKL